MDSIIIIEDDRDLLEGIEFSLTKEGYKVETAATYKSGKTKIMNDYFDLILLDCNLPDGNGFTLCDEVRAFSDIPILMLTARDTELDEIKALKLGVDDFMTKPFSLGVLLARIHNLIRRKRNNHDISTNGILVKQKEGIIIVNNERIQLTSLEFKFLLYLIENKNQIISKEQMLHHIWDNEGKFVDDNIVSVYIRRLRKKVEIDANNPAYIKTVHGAGYMWKEDIE